MIPITRPGDGRDGGGRGRELSLDSDMISGTRQFGILARPKDCCILGQIAYSNKKTRRQ